MATKLRSVDVRSYHPDVELNVRFFRFADDLCLWRSSVTSIQQSFRRSNGHTFVVGIHQGREAFDRPWSMSPSELLDFSGDPGTASGVAAVPWVPGRFRRSSFPSLFLCVLRHQGSFSEGSGGSEIRLRLVADLRVFCSILPQSAELSC